MNRPLTPGPLKKVPSIVPAQRNLAPGGAVTDGQVTRLAVLWSNIPDDCLAARIDVNVLDPHELRPPVL